MQFTDFKNINTLNPFIIQNHDNTKPFLRETNTIENQSIQILQVSEKYNTNNSGGNGHMGYMIKKTMTYI